MLENLYNHIDLLYYFDDAGTFKYDFVVHPGGNPDDILIQYDGQTALTINNEELVIETSVGNINEGSPFSYTQDGTPISTRYEIMNGNTLKFAVSHYDKNEVLTIDPSIQWNKVLGGGVDDFIEDSKIDAQGNSYIVGHTSSKDNLLPFTPGAFQATPNALEDAYIAKLDPNGDVLWASFYGGNENDYANGIDIDNSNNLYITGYTESLDFPTSANGSNTNQGGSELFVLKFDTDGNRLFGGIYGGASGDVGEKIVVTETNEVFVVGSTSSEFFPSENPIAGTGDDAIVMKLNSDLSSYVWTKYLGGATGDQGFGLDVDQNGDVLITGRTSSNSGFPVTASAYMSTAGGSQDAYLIKLAGNTGDVVYGTYLGGDEDDWGEDVVIDQENNSYVIGYTSSENFPSQNGYQQTYQGGVSDGFVTKFNSNGQLLWSTYLGGTATDELKAGIIGPLNALYVVGSSESTDFPTKRAIQSENAGNFDMVITRFAEDGMFTFSSYWGGPENDFGDNISNGTDTIAIVLFGESQSAQINGDAIGNTGGFDMLISSFNVGDLFIDNEITIENNQLDSTQLNLCLNDTIRLIGSSINSQFNKQLVTFQYQDSIPGSGWQDVDGGDSKDYEQAATTAGTFYYRRIATLISDTTLKDTSNTITVNVSDQTIENNEISFEDDNTAFTQCVTSNNPIAINGSTAIPTSGSIAYQYVIYNANVDQFQAINGANNQDYTFEKDTADGQYVIGRYAFSADDPICKDLATVEITLDPQIISNNTISTNATIYTCEGQPTFIDGSDPVLETGNPSYIYYDSIAGGSFQPISNGTEQDLTYQAEDTTYIVREVVADGVLNTCSSYSDTITIIPVPYPTAQFTFDTSNQSFCVGNAIQFTNETVNSEAIENWSWTFGKGDNQTSEVENPSFTYNTAGQYSVMLFVTSQYGCEDDTTMMLEIWGTPTVNAGDDIIITTEKNTVQLQATSTPVDSISWTPTFGVSNPAVLQPNVDATMENTYTITVFDENGCSATDEVAIIRDLELFIPSAFTPNGDNYNDVFEISNIQLHPDAKIYIYNRWGNRIFSSSDLVNNPWDGKYEGEKVPGGVYYYKLDLGSNEELIERTITVLD